MSRKFWIVAPLVLCLAALAGGWWWWHAGEPAPQIITLPNGMTYRFAGATYGTNHVMGPRLDVAIQRMPKPLANIARQMFRSHLGRMNRHTTPQPTLCVWFEPLSTNGPAAMTATVYAMLADESGVLSGERASVFSWSGTASQWLHEDFPAVPRRSRVIECRFYQYMRGDKYREIGRVRFPNPLSGEYPRWQPEPLPATKMAGDVEVQLESFSAGHGNAFESVYLPGGKTARRVSSARPGEEVRAAFDLSFKSPRGTNEQWTVESAELSDATGNRLRASSRSESEDRYFAIGPTPWPSERAWKLKLELERKGPFLPEELVTFTDLRVPEVGETNSIAPSNNLSGVTFRRIEFRRRDDITGNSWSSRQATCIRLEHSKIPEGYSLEFVKMEANNGAKLQPLGRSWSGDYYEVPIKSVPEGVESVDITYAVQRTRTVEFLVKPEVAPAEPQEAKH